MDLFWMGVIPVIVLAYLAAGTALILLWRRSGIRKMETALVQLQNELDRVSSLLEETKVRILGAESGIRDKPADREQPVNQDSDIGVRS